jgi:glycosyltransferase involved in cell wall biosynthesis
MAPHRIASFNALVEDPDLDVVVVYLTETDPSRAWGTHETDMRFRNRVLQERWRVRRGDSYLHLTTGLAGTLRELRPDVLVVGGWDQAAYLEAYALRSMLGAKFLWWVESNLRDRRSESPTLRRTKRALLAGADGVVVPGSASRDYVAELGADDVRVWVAPNAVDNDGYRRGVPDRSERSEPVKFLFVGRLESEKGLLTLLDAWIVAGGDCELTIVGDGSLRGRIGTRVEGSTMPPTYLPGHLGRDDLAKRYAQADVFVFPSVSDPWGLVLNEAMASGLPLVTTSAPGAVDDLVIHGRNGLVVEPFDVVGLATAMSTLTADAALRLSMGAESSSIIAGFEPETWAAGMREAVLGVLGEAA